MSSEAVLIALMVSCLSLEQVAEYQVTEIPDGIRQHPYRRDRLPTLEAPDLVKKTEVLKDLFLVVDVCKLVKTVHRVISYKCISMIQYDVIE